MKIATLALTLCLLLSVRSVSGQEKAHAISGRVLVPEGYRIEALVMSGTGGEQEVSLREDGRFVLEIDSTATSLRFSLRQTLPTRRIIPIGPVRLGRLRNEPHRLVITLRTHASGLPEVHAAFLAGTNETATARLAKVAPTMAPAKVDLLALQGPERKPALPAPAAEPRVVKEEAEDEMSQDEARRFDLTGVDPADPAEVVRRAFVLVANAVDPASYRAAHLALAEVHESAGRKAQAAAARRRAAYWRTSDAE